jgi:hypothetical protein
MIRCFLPDGLPRGGGCLVGRDCPIPPNAIHQPSLKIFIPFQIRAMPTSSYSQAFGPLCHWGGYVFWATAMLGLRGSRNRTLKAKYDKAFRGPPFQPTPSPLRD